MSGVIKKKYIAAVETAADAMDETVNAVLVSAAIPDALPDASSAAQPGWIVGAQPSDAASTDPAATLELSFELGNPYTGGPPIDPASGQVQTPSSPASPYDPAGTLEDPIPIYDASGNVQAWQYQDENGNWVTEPIDQYEGVQEIVFPDDRITAAPTTAPSPPNPAPVDPFPTLTSAQEQELNNAIQQAVQGGDPNVIDTPPTEGVTPFHPMADSPLAQWLLYGNDTPVLDALTNDANLQMAQNVAAGVALGAGAIATGGMLLELAPGLAASAASAGTTFQSTALTAAPFVPAAGALIARNPQAIQEFVEEAESFSPEIENVLQSAPSANLPSLSPQLEEIMQATEGAIPSAAPQAFSSLQNMVPTGPSFEGLINIQEFEEDEAIIDRLTRAREFDISGYRSLTGSGPYGRVGDNLDSDEALQNAFIRMVKNVDRLSSITRNNPSIALSPQYHQLIQNLRTAEMQGMTADQVLQYHLQQLSAFVPEYIVRTLEQESHRYILETF